MSDALPTSVAEQWGKHTMADINSRMKAPEWSCLVPHPDDPSKLVCYVGVPCTHVGLSQNCHKCINRVRPCGDVTAKPKDNRLGNFKKHLERIHGTKRERERDQSEGNEATHSVSQSSVPAQGQLIQSTIPECAAKRAANYTGNPLLANAQQREKEAIAFAVNGISFAVCQSEEFRVAYSPSIILGRDMSAQTVVTCKQMLALKIAATKNLPVTLAFDSGTVWRRWFAVMVIVPGQVPFIVGIKNSESFSDGKLTAENLEAYLREILNLVQATGGTVVAFVADNAGNMQKAICHDILGVKCGAHILALFVKDLMSTEVLSEALKVAVRVYNSDKKKYPSPCETRWNSLLRLILAILSEYEKKNVSAGESEDEEPHQIFNVDEESVPAVVDLVDDPVADENDDQNESQDAPIAAVVAGEEGAAEPNEFLLPDDGDSAITLPVVGETANGGIVTDDEAALLTRASLLLAPFLSATNWLQSNTSTIFDMAIVFAELICSQTNSTFDCYRAPLADEKRKKMILQPAVAFIAYYHPDVSNSDADATLLAYLKLNTLALTSLLRMQRSTEEMLLAEMDSFEERGLRSETPREEGYTASEYVGFWRAQTNFPTLSGLLEVLVVIACTEACVERSFSEIKACFRSNRQSAKDTVIASQFILKSLFLKPSKHKPLKGENRFEANFMHDSFKSKRFTSKHAKALATCVPMIPRQKKTKAKRTVSSQPGIAVCCGMFKWSHTRREEFLKCSVCLGLWMRDCLDMKVSVYNSIVERLSRGGVWLCPRCKYQPASGSGTTAQVEMQGNNSESGSNNSSESDSD